MCVPGDQNPRPQDIKSESEETVQHPEYPAPDGLSDRSRALWAEVVPYRAVSAGRIALVEEALRALDRADQMRVTVDKDGPLTVNETTGMTHVHPCVKIERESRQAFSRLWTQMGLQWSSDEDGTIRHRLARMAAASSED